MLQITALPSTRPQSLPQSPGNHVVATVVGEGPHFGVAPRANQIASSSLASEGVDLLSTLKAMIDSQPSGTAPRLPNSWGSDAPSTARLYLNDLQRIRLA